MSKITKKPPKWSVYLLRCRNGSLYCGITTDIKRRVSEHNSGKGAKYIVPRRRPVKCVWKQVMKNQSDALKLEHRIKKFSVKKKEVLVMKGVKAVEKMGRDIKQK